MAETLRPQKIVIDKTKTTALIASRNYSSGAMLSIDVSSIYTSVDVNVCFRLIDERLAFERSIAT